MQTKKIIGLLLFLLVILFNPSFSQENYLPGTIVSKNGDTINGLIDYRNWERNPSTIRFKERLDDNFTIYEPTDIIEFKVHDEIYVSGIVETEISPSKISDIQINPELQIKIDTTFLQTLFRGAKSLFYYKSAYGKDNFYIEHDSSYELLVHKKYLIRQDGELLITEYKKYLGQLILYLDNCSSIQQKSKNTSYSLTSLSKLFKYYYSCSNDNKYYQKKDEKISTEFGALIGISSTSLIFKSDAYPDLVNAKYDNSINFSAGLFFDLVFPRNQGKWSINNELLFTTYNVESTNKDYGDNNYYKITTTEIGYSYLKINNLVRFKYPIRGVFLYFNGGISNGFAISETNYKKVELKLFITESIDEELALKETKKYELGYIFGMGTKFKKFSFEIRYERGNGMSEYIALNSSTNRYFLLFGYKFN